MEKEEILEKSQKKSLVGEMEATKTNKANWIALISAGTVAVALMITLGALGIFEGLYAIATVCFVWASVFYFCQYFIAKRPWPVLIGAVLEALGGITMITLLILTVTQVL
ncbi:MAG: hypothetical protein J6K97_01760 [Clostridia bacterium]|nr:hypothetical protein [Clostridia bacterium]